jgi:hypothetical protein
MNLPKSRQDDIKDVGGFVGGLVKGGRRKVSNMAWRDLITLDMDFAPLNFAEVIANGLGKVTYLLYGTHKYRPDNPRIRIVIPLLRGVTPDEYQAISRRLAADIGMDFFDDTTYEPHRLMYWPSTPDDIEYYFKAYEGIWINPTLENTAPTLLHEVQHAIQRIEGFARGGNTGSVKTKADALREDVRPLHEMMLDTPEWAERQRLQNRWFDETDEAEIAKIEQRVNEINESGVLDAIQSKRKQLQEKYGSDATVGKILGSPYAEDAEIWQQLPESFNDKYEAYRNLAGEAEARNVSARLNMSEEERRQTRPGKTEDVAREEQTVIYAEVSDKAGAQLEETANATRYSIVVDPQLIAELEASPKRKGYRNVVQREDGLFEAPMGNSLRGNGITVENTPFAMGQWEQSEEHPELVYGDNKITLVKPDGKTVADVNYNPYIHNRLNTLNAQFKQAWERPDLVYIETEVPETDLEGGYMAEHAHLSTGVHQWSNGALMLSRYDKPVRIVPWDEVAIPWIEKYKKSGVHFDIVPPALRPVLTEAGVEIKAPHNGMGENCTKAYEEWKAEPEANKKGSAESRTSKATQGERSDADSHNSSSKGLPLESSERLSVSALASPKDFAKIKKIPKTKASN